MTSRNKREGWFDGKARTFRYAASLQGFKAWNKQRLKDNKPPIKTRPGPL